MKPSPRLRTLLLTAIVFVVAFDVAFLWQRLTKAHLSEFRGSPTEAAHFLSGLVLHDYVKSGMSVGLGHYVEKYEWHYSAVDVAQAPAFHALEAGWMLAAGAGRGSALLLMAIFGALLGIAVFKLLLKEVGAAWGAVGAVACLCLPVVQRGYLNVGPDLVCAAAVFGALLALVALLESGRWLWAACFALLGALAVLTGAHVAVIVSLAFLTPVFAGNTKALRLPALWGGFAAAALLIGGWFWLAGPDSARSSWEFRTLRTESLGDLLLTFRSSTGPVLLVLAVYGLLVVLRNPLLGRNQWAASSSVVIGGLLAAAIAGAANAERHLLIAIVGILLFAVAGAAGFGKLATAPAANPPEPSVIKTALAAVVFAIGIGALVYPVKTKEFSGFGGMAAELVRVVKPGQTILVSSDQAGEGAFSAELALRDPARPSFAVHRAGEMLTQGNPPNGDRSRAYENEEQVITFLRRTNVRHLVQDESLAEDERSQYYNLVRQTITQGRGNFLRQAHTDAVRHGDLTSAGVVLYLVDNLPE